MKLVIQRVSRAAVRVGGETVGQIGRGYLVLLGAEVGDAAEAAEEAARKVAGLRVFDDAGGKMNLALADVGGAILAVSQFTLAADSQAWLHRLRCAGNPVPGSGGSA